MSEYRVEDHIAEEQKIKRNLIISGIVLLVALLGFGISLYVNHRNSQIKIDPTKIGVPKMATSFGSFHMNKNGEIISPDDKNYKPSGKRVEMFFDPHCPACGYVDQNLHQTLDTAVKSGQVDLYLTPLNFLDQASTDEYSTRAVNALITVMENDSSKTLPFITALYDSSFQPAEGPNYKKVSDNKLIDLAKKIGVKNDVAESFKDHSYVTWIKKNTEKQGARTDVFPDGLSTPNFIAGGHMEDGKVKNGTPILFSKNKDISETFLQAVASAKN